jgi:hypothetical protein
VLSERGTMLRNKNFKKELIEKKFSAKYIIFIQPSITNKTSVWDPDPGPEWIRIQVRI